MTIEVGNQIQKSIGYLHLTDSGPLRPAEILIGLLLLVLLLRFALRNITTTVLTLRALALAPTVSRRLSSWVKSLDYSEDEVWTADGAGDRSRGAMGAFVVPRRQSGAMHLDSDTQALGKSFINAPVYGRLCGPGESTEQGLDGHAHFGRNLHGKTLGLEFGDCALQISVIRWGEA